MHLPAELGTLNHAHPSPTQSSLRALEERRIQALVAHQSINVDLRGLSCEHAVTVSDLLTPKIRRSPFNEEVIASHLDLTECWKGLSHSQATELLMWYQFLHKCLQSEVRASLYNDLVKSLSQSEEAIDEVYLVPRMLEYLHSRRHRVIDVSFVDLIDSMMGMFHDRFPNAAAAIASNWSQFSGGLSLFLQNFLRIQDCFLELPHGPCLLVDFDFTYADYLLTATGDVTWHLPCIRFLNLRSNCFPGEEYRITPFTLKNTHSPASLYGCDDYVDETSYTLARSSLSLSWDAMKRCFKTLVPSYSDVEPRNTETVLSATTSTPFPDHVQFERQSRWSIKLVIEPPESTFKACTTNKNESVKLDNIDKHSFRNMLQCNPPHTRIQTSSRDLAHNAVYWKVLAGKSDFSRQKRKVSRPEVVGAGLDAKRQRHDLAHVFEADASHQTHSDHADEESIQTFRWGEENGARADEYRSNAAHPDAAQSQASPPAMSSHTGSGQLEQHDSSTPSPESGPSSLNNTAPNSAVEKDGMGLQQQQIMRNYLEFAELRLYKDAGVVSPASEGERTAFENIFLEEGEPWSPVTDGSALDLDTVMGEV
ncbi:hypothetical protein EKO04_010627 [Ascochyta lentis]|uniref:Uncharacterized protein n=1 Tax=Ascochyta lentis TaxID=205686 RepID=A0A8H7MDW1_9PLEO|nr:hypothetical protein EKO04_010627 [Ascochyta lentis]